MIILQVKSLLQFCAPWRIYWERELKYFQWPTLQLSNNFLSSTSFHLEIRLAKSVQIYRVYWDKGISYHSIDISTTLQSQYSMQVYLCRGNYKRQTVCPILCIRKNYSYRNKFQKTTSVSVFLATAFLFSRSDQQQAVFNWMVSGNRLGRISANV